MAKLKFKAWQLSYDCLTTARQLPDNCLTTAVHFQTNAWQLPDNCRKTGWQQLFTSRWLPGTCLMLTTWWMPAWLHDLTTSIKTVSAVLLNVLLDSDEIGHQPPTTDTQWRHKSEMGRCGRQNMLWPYLKIWDWDWIFDRAVKAISSLGVLSPWTLHTEINLPLQLNGKTVLNHQRTVIGPQILLKKIAIERDWRIKNLLMIVLWHQMILSKIAKDPKSGPDQKWKHQITKEYCILQTALIQI